jgi:hypothetical protein
MEDCIIESFDLGVEISVGPGQLLHLPGQELHPRAHQMLRRLNHSRGILSSIWVSAINIPKKKAINVDVTMMANLTI